MDMESITEFSFDEALYQVWLQIDSDICRNKGLLNLIKKQTLKWLDDAVAQSRLAGYVVHEAELLKVWEQLQRQDKKAIKLKLAQGWPQLPGFECKASHNKESEFTISLPHDAHTIQGWSFCWIEARIQAELDKIHEGLKFNPVPVEAYFIHAQSSRESCDSSRAFSYSSQASFHHDKPYHVLKNNRKGYIELVVYQPSILEDSKAQRSIQDEIQAGLVEMRESRPLHRIIPHDIPFLEILDHARNGPESLKLNLPIRMLGGLVIPTPLDQRRENSMRLLRQGVAKRSRELEAIDWMDPATGAQTLGISGYDHDLFVSLGNSLADESMATVPAERRFMITVSLTLHPQQHYRIEQILDELVQRMLVNSSKKEDQPECVPHHFFLHLFPMAIFEGKAKADSSPGKTDHPWLNTVLREMTQFPNFYLDVSWIRDRLIMPVDTHEIELSLQRLKNQGFINFDPTQKKWVPHHPTVMTQSQLQGTTASAFYKSILTTSSHCLTRVPPQMRIVKGLSCYMSPEDFQKHRNDIEKTTKSLLDLEQEEKVRTRVYTLLLGLFPAE